MSDVLSDIIAKIAQVTTLMKTLESSQAHGNDDPLVLDGINNARQILIKLESRKNLLEAADRVASNSGLVGTR